MLNYQRVCTVQTSPNHETKRFRSAGPTAQFPVFVWSIVSAVGMESLPQIKLVYEFPTHTLWLFNIAMENGPFIDDFPIETTIYSGFSMAMLNNQMVDRISRLSFLDVIIGANQLPDST